MHKVLVVDDDKILQSSVKDALVHHHFIVDTADNGKEALSKVYKESYDFVLMDVNMPEMDGLTALNEIKKHDPSIVVLILTAYSNVDDAKKAIKDGAYDYLEKPIQSENLVLLIKRALRARSLVETSAFSAPSLSLGEGADKFVGESDIMKKVFNVISRLAQVNTPVLIRGESGTGKELVAKAIHYNGPRKSEKFVTINLAAIPETLIESELFGHEKGAFTGASERKIGKFQYADGGTLFLDEIGDISPAMQVKLLRVLQEKSFTPVGSNRDIKVDVRIIAASHKPFEKMIKEGSFREDLFYRLNVLPVYLPPLRDRASDLPALLDYYIKYFNKLHNLNIKGPNPEAKALLEKYPWPGNIRELRNVIEHAFIIESGDTITPASLPASVVKNQVSAPTVYKEEKTLEEDFASNLDVDDIRDSVLRDFHGEGNTAESGSLKISFTTKNDESVNLDFQIAKELFEKEFIAFALKVNKGKINQTALKANIPKKTLLRKIEKYEINPKEFYK
jgi:DNA-binding NtrC family response regulator